MPRKVEIPDSKMNANNLKFSDLVRQDYILVDLDASTREDALSQMAQLLVDRGNCEPTFVEAILHREKAHPSGLPMPGPKIAIPHTDAEHIRNSVILFARLVRPVEFLSMGGPDDRLSVQMISMFALKEKKRIGDMLETLINVYQNQEILEAILGAPDRMSIFSLLKNAVEEYGR